MYFIGYVSVGEALSCQVKVSESGSNGESSHDDNTSVVNRIDSNDEKLKKNSTNIAFYLLGQKMELGLVCNACVHLSAQCMNGLMTLCRTHSVPSLGTLMINTLGHPFWYSRNQFLTH